MSEWYDGVFGGSVVEKIGLINVGVDGGVVDDGCIMFYVFEGVFWSVEEWVNVDVESVFLLFFR